VVPPKHGNRKWQYHQSACPRAARNLRLLQSRLGCMLAEANRKWSLVSSGSQKAYKCSQTQGSLSCHQSLSQRPVEQESVPPHGQHHSSVPHHNKGVTRSPQLVNLLLKLLQWCLQKSILITAQHLTGKLNNATYGESRVLRLQQMANRPVTDPVHPNQVHCRSLCVTLIGKSVKCVQQYLLSP